MESKLKLRASAKLKKHLENLRLKSLNKKVSLETRALIREKALNRKFTEEVKKKMSVNNNKPVKILAYYADTNLLYKEFNSLTEAAEHFYNDRNRRAPIKYALAKNKLILKKFFLRFK